MADIDKAFQASVADAKTNDNPNVKLSNDDKLKFYALFKQATIGEVTGNILHDKK